MVQLKCSQAAHVILKNSSLTHLRLQLYFVHLIGQIFKISTQMHTKLLNACFSVTYGLIDGIPNGNDGRLHSSENSEVFGRCGDLILFNELVHLNHHVPFIFKAFDLNGNIGGLLTLSES